MITGEQSGPSARVDRNSVVMSGVALISLDLRPGWVGTALSPGSAFPETLIIFALFNL